MKKVYEKPDVKEVELVNDEVRTSNDVIDGEMGLESAGDLFG